MTNLSDKSLELLKDCHPNIQKVVLTAAKSHNFVVTCSHRGKEAQDEAVRTGKSRTPFPTSKHNVLPSLAVDLAPNPVDWADRNRFIYLAGVIMGIAEVLDIKMRWGGDFNRDGNLKNDSFIDLPHFELI